MLRRGLQLPWRGTWMHGITSARQVSQSTFQQIDRAVGSQCAKLWVPAPPADRGEFSSPKRNATAVRLALAA